MTNEMEVLRSLYKAQIEIAEAYEMTQNNKLRDIYNLLDTTVVELEEELEIFKED